MLTTGEPARLRYLSLFSGIEAATLAWAPLGWEAVAFAEIEPFPSAVLAARWPDVPNLGDITKVDWRPYRGRVDLVVGGSPCQSFSVAGLRTGLADPRGNLALEFLRAVDTVRPRWLVWENVPGVLSSNAGRDFGTFVATLAELGYGFAWRVLDAQHFGVPHQRRRLFVVGHSGACWQRAAAVLLERHSLRRNPAPRGAARSPVARSLTASTGGVSAKEQQHTFVGAAGEPLNALSGSPGEGGGKPGQGYPAVVFEARHYTRGQGGPPSDTVPCLKTHKTGGPGDAEPLVMAFKPSHYTRAKGGAPTEVAPCLKAQAGETGKGDSAPLVMASGQANAELGRECSPALAARQYKDPPIAVNHRDAVRRLTPRECERLQGMPDDHTLIAWRGKPVADCPDGPRYKAIGNSMAVPVMRWIGERILAVEAEQKEEG